MAIPTFGKEVAAEVPTFGKPLEEAPAAVPSFGKPADEAQAESPSKGFLSRPITDAELQVIGEHHGVDWKALSESVEYMGGTRADIAPEAGAQAMRGAKEAAGFLGQSLGMNIPQKIAIELQDDPKMKAALYDLRALADEKKGYGRDVAEVAASIGGAVGLGRAAAKGAAKVFGQTQAAKTATTAYDAASAVGGGAAAGYAGAKPDDELKQAAIGGGLGIAGYGLVAGAAKLIQRSVRKGTEATLEQAATSPNMTEALAEKALKTQDADAVSARALTLVEGGARDADQIAKLAEDPEQLRRAAQQALDDMDSASLKDLRAELKDMRIPADKEAGYILQRRVDVDTIELAQTLSRSERSLPLSEARKVVDGYIAREGAPYVERAYAAMRDVSNARKLVGEALQKLDTDQGALGNFISTGFRDARYAYNKFDRRLGTEATAVIDELSTANNRYTVRLGAEIPELARLTDLTAAAQVDPKDLYRVLDTGVQVAEDTPGGQVVQSWRDYFEKLREDANNAFGADVIKPFTREVNGQKVTSYVPHMTVSRSEMATRLSDVIDQLDATHGTKILSAQASPEQLKALAADGRWAQLQAATKYVHGTGARQASLADVASAYRDVVSGRPLKREPVSDASAAFQRTMEEVPELIRETDVSKLASRWMLGTFKHAYMRDGLAKLQRFRDLAAIRGDKQAADYAEKHLIDLIAPSARTTVANYVSSTRLTAYMRLQKAAQTSKLPGARGLAEFLSDDSQALGLIARQVYPNFLGFSVRAALTNLTQPFLVTLPELGYKYATPKVLSAYAQMAQDLSKGRTFVLKNQAVAAELGAKVGDTVTSRNLAHYLRNEGQLQRQWNSELESAVTSSVSAGWIGRKTKGALEKYTQVAMYMYEAAEKANRAIALNVADSVTRDLLSGSADARKFMLTIEPAYRTRFQQLLKSGNQEQLQESVRNFVVGRTLFNYDKNALSEYGRSMGHLFSTFTKWPITVASNVLEEYETKGALGGSMRVVAKYILPVVALYTFSNLMEDEDGPSPQQQFLFGKQGLHTAAPIGSLTAVATGDLLAPPVLGVPGEVLRALVTADPDKGLKAIENAFSSFMPGAGLIRFVFIDLPRALGEQPESRTAGEATSKAAGIREE
jgi:hypothetical protein